MEASNSRRRAPAPRRPAHCVCGVRQPRCARGWLRARVDPDHLPTGGRQIPKGRNRKGAAPAVWRNGTRGETVIRGGCVRGMMASTRTHARTHTLTRTRAHAHTCTRTHGMHTHTRIHACQHVHTRTHSYPDLTCTAPLFGGAGTGSRQHARARSWFLLQVFAAEVRIPRGCLPRIVRHRVAIMPQDQLNQAWHADQAVQYYSSSQGLWLDATVLRVHTDGHVTIDIRGRVSEAKIRPRVPVSHTVVVVLSTQWGSVDFLLLPKKESEGGKGRGGGRQNSMNERLLASEHHAPFPVARLA